MIMGIELIFGFFLAGLVPIAVIVLLIVYINKTNSILRKMGVMDSVLFRLRSIEDDVAALRRELTTHHEPVRPATPAVSDVRAEPQRQPTSLTTPAVRPIEPVVRAE